MGSKKKKKTAVGVSMQAFNLAGVEEERDEYLKNTLLAATLARTKPWLGSAIVKSYLDGPGIKLRKFAQWDKKTGFSKDVLKFRSSLINTGSEISSEVIQNAIRPSDPDSVLIDVAEIVEADIYYWALQYLSNYRPDVLEKEWTAGFTASNSLATIRVYAEFFKEDSEGDFENDSSAGSKDIYEVEEIITFSPQNFDPLSRYLVAAYMLAIEKEDGEFDVEEEQNANHVPIPSLDGFVLIQSQNSPQTRKLVTTTVTTISYSDGRPGDTSTLTTYQDVNYDRVENIYEKLEYKGIDDADTSGEFTYIERTLIYVTTDRDIKTRTSTTGETIPIVVESEDEDEEPTVVYKYIRYDTTYEELDTKTTHQKMTQQVEQRGYSRTQFFFYRVGSNINATLENLFGKAEAYQDMLPVIPVRIENKFLSSSYFPDIYKQGDIALKRFMNTSMEDVQGTIKDSEDLSHIDHAFVVFGIPLAARRESSLKYMYLFFQDCIRSENVTAYEKWEQGFNDRVSSGVSWRNWVNAQTDPNHFLFGTPAPDVKADINYGKGNYTYYLDKSGITFNSTLSWGVIREDVIPGKLTQWSKKGDIAFEWASWAWQDTLVPLYAKLSQHTNPNIWGYIRAEGTFFIAWQDEEHSHRVITVAGIEQRSIIYNGHAFTTQPTYLGWSNPGNLGSGYGRDLNSLLIPVRHGILDRMGIVDYTQVGLECKNLQLNSYEVVVYKIKKSRFGGLFKIIAIVVVIVIAAYTGGAGAGLSGFAGGVGGTVAGAVGATGLLASAIAIATNTIVAIVVTNVITSASTAVFGEKWGSIIGVITSIVVNAGIQSYANSGSIGWAESFGQLMKPQNLLQIADSVVNSIQQQDIDKIGKYHDETLAVIAEYEKRSTEIEEMFKAEFLTGNTVDISKIQEMVADFTFRVESPANFLGRTLMVGDDIVELANSMIADFANMTTTVTLDLP